MSHLDANNKRITRLSRGLIHSDAVLLQQILDHINNQENPHRTTHKQVLGSAIGTHRHELSDIDSGYFSPGTYTFTELSKVGIGIDPGSSSAKLQVVGNVQITGELHVDDILLDGDYISLYQMNDVTLGTLSDGDVLTYNISTSKWENQAPSGGSAHALSSHTDVTITDITTGEILFYDSGIWINNTLAEAGIAAASHTHDAEDINPGTFGTGDYSFVDGKISMNSNSVGPLLNIYHNFPTFSIAGDYATVNILSQIDHLQTFDAFIGFQSTVISESSGAHYAGNFTVAASQSGGNNYGIYASAEGSTIKNWAGYFNEGNVGIVNHLNLGVAADNTTEEFGIKFGASADTNLYRSAANTLKTDDNLIISLDLNVLNDIYVNGVLLALTHLNDVAFTSLSNGEVLTYNSGTSKWENQAPSGGSHTLDSHSNVKITSIASGELLKWNGSDWVNNTLAEAGIAAASHTHSANQITNGMFNPGIYQFDGTSKVGFGIDPSLSSALLQVSGDVNLFGEVLVDDLVVTGLITQDDILKPTFSVGGNISRRLITIKGLRFDNTETIHNRIMYHWWISTTDFGPPTDGGHISMISLSAGTNFGTVSKTSVNTAFSTNNELITIDVIGTGGSVINLYIHVEIQGIIYSQVFTLEGNLD